MSAVLVRCGLLERTMLMSRHGRKGKADLGLVREFGGHSQASAHETLTGASAGGGLELKRGAWNLDDLET